MRKWLAVAVIAVLTACGNDPVDNSKPDLTEEERCIADGMYWWGDKCHDQPEATRASVQLNYHSDALTVSWVAVHHNESGYRIELNEQQVSRQQDDWKVAATSQPVAKGFKGQLQLPAQSGQYRVFATFDDGSAELLASNQGTAIFSLDVESATDLAIVPPQVEQPYRGKIVYGLNQPVHAVGWFIDTKNACTYPNTCAEQSITVDTERLTDGQHRIDASAELSKDVVVQLNSVFGVYNPALTLSVTVDQNASPMPVYVNASSKAEVTEVAFYIDDQLQEALTESDPVTVEECHRGSCWGKTYDYTWYWQPIYGEHLLEVITHDTDGVSASFKQDLLINNAAVVDIVSPKANSMISDDNLLVSGYLSDDDDDATLYVMLGDIQIGYASETGPFSFEYPLAGLPGGAYTLSFLAVDGFGVNTRKQVSFHYDAAVDAKLVAELPAGANLIEIAHGYALSSLPGNAYQVKNLTTGHLWEVELSELNSPSYEHVDHKGNLVLNVYGRQIIYVTPQGQTNLTKQISQVWALGPHNSNAGDTVIFNGDWYMTAWNSSTGESELISRPDGSPFWLNHRWHHTESWFCNAAKHQGRYDLYLYVLGSGNLQRITTNPADTNTFCAGIDDSRFAYTTSDSDGTSFYLADLNSPANRQLLSDAVSGNGISAQAKFHHGMAAWIDSANKQLNVRTEQGLVYQLEANAYLRELKDGILTYAVDGELFSFYGSGSQRIWPSSARHFIGSDAVYLVSGQLIYQVQI